MRPSFRPVILFQILSLAIAGVLLAVWLHPPLPAKYFNLLEAALSGKMEWRWQAYVALWLPRAAAADAALLLTAALLAPWLLARPDNLPASPVDPPRFPGSDPDCDRKTPSPPKWLPALVIGACLLGSAWLNAPRLHHSLWGDEEFSMSHFMVGEYETEPDGSLSWHEVPWSRTWWDHRVPNNHAVYSFLAKAAHTAFEKSHAPDALPFSEWRLRLPAFLAGLLALPALYWLAKEMNLPWAGLAGVVLMAAHPWLVRYSTEARGYGLILLLWPCAALSLLRGIRDGRWRWWLLFGFLEFLMMGSWTGSVHWLTALNLAGLGLMFWKSHPAARFQFRRWTAAQGLAVFCYLPLAMPMAPQLRAWMATGRAKAVGIAPRWLADSASWLVSGEPWRSPDPANPLCPGRAESLATAPVFNWICLAAGSAALLWGLTVFLTKSRTARWMLPAMLLPIGTLALQAAVTGNLLMPWYACPALPAAALMAGAMLENIHRHRRNAIPVVILMATSLLAGHRMRSLLSNHEMEPNRPAVSLSRNVLNPSHPDFGRKIITAQFSCRRPGYDPGSHEIQTAAQLESLIAEAQKAGADLFVNIGDFGAAIQRWPEILAILQDPARFHPPTILPGMDHAQTRVVWRAAPGSAQ